MSFLQQLCSHSQLCLFAALFEGLDTFALYLCDWPIIKIVKLFVLEHKLSPELVDHTDGWVSFDVEANNLLEVAQKVEHIGMVVDQITLDIESAQVWQCLQLLTVLCLGDEVVRDVESLDLSQALETLHYFDLVVRQIDRVEFGQG